LVSPSVLLIASSAASWFISAETAFFVDTHHRESYLKNGTRHHACMNLQQGLWRGFKYETLSWKTTLPVRNIRYANNLNLAGGIDIAAEDVTGFVKW